MITGIIFDLGNTLIYTNRSWDAIAQEGVEAVANWYFKKKRVKLDTEAFIKTFLAERAAGIKQATQTQREVLLTEALQKTLQHIEAPPRAGAMLTAAAKIFFGPEEVAYQVHPDAIDMLKLLQQQDYKLGLYSNAADDFLIQRLVNRHGLRPWLAPTFSSAGCGWRKPHAAAFTFVAQRWQVPAQEIVVVGDTLSGDILGAENAGMASILITRNEPASNSDNRHIQPHKTVSTLAEIPTLIKQL